ncbi:MAG: glycosyltransferase family 4 protein [Candidatus Scalindua sp.]
MNICIFSTVTYWHGLRGGMDLHGKHLLEGLSGRGHKIIVISTKHPSGKEYEEINGIKIHYLKHTTFGSSRKGWKRQSINKFKDIIKTEEIDIALSQQTAGYGIAKIARRKGIPFITIMHGYEIMIFRSIFNQVMNFKKDYLSLVKSFLSSLYYTVFQELPILKDSSAIIAVSEGVSKVIEKRPFIDRDKIKVINYGIDLKLFKFSEEERKETRLKLNITNHDKVVLFLSLLSKQKGTDIAIKAFNELAENNESIKLIIAGDGEYLEEAKLLVNNFKLKSRVIFTGFVRNEDTVQYYNASDIFIFPTLRLESFGIVIAEAMACGKPVIASDIGSIPDVIDNGINGILIPIGDFKELARQINLLLSDKQYSAMLAQNARRKALERFGLDRMIEETIKVFELARTHK